MRVEKPIQLTRRDALQISRLLGRFQDHLETAIESVLAEGETKAFDPKDQPGLEIDRRDWTAAERIITLLEEQKEHEGCAPEPPRPPKWILSISGGVTRAGRPPVVTEHPNEDAAKLALLEYVLRNWEVEMERDFPPKMIPRAARSSNTSTTWMSPT
jgi:hypothetical protein